MRVDAWGPWNLKCTAEYARQLRTCLGGIPRPFAILVVSHGRFTLSAEAEAILRSNVRWRVSHGCVAQATVLQGEPDAMATYSLFERIYCSERLPYSIFATLREALRWLSQRGFREAEQIPEKGPSRATSTSSVAVPAWNNFGRVLGSDAIAG